MASETEVGARCTCATDGSARRCRHHSQADFESTTEPLDLDAIEARASVADRETWMGSAQVDDSQADVRALASEVRRLRAEVKATLYPLGQHTPESSAALAEDIGASEDSLFVQWIRRGQENAALRAEVAPTTTEWGVLLYGRVETAVSEASAREAVIKFGASLASREVTAWTEATP